MKKIAAWLHNLIPHCKDITMLMVKEQEIELSWVEKTRLHFHILVCKFCRIFRVQSAQLDKHVHNLSKESSHFTLNAQQKAALKTVLDKHQ